MVRLFLRSKTINLLIRLSGIIPTKVYLHLLFRVTAGYSLNLKNPRSFNEKLQWLKMYWRNDTCPVIVDKYDMKGYVRQVIGEGYTFDTLGVWNDPRDIDFTSLPDKFVLKTTHGGGGDGVIICKDKSELDVNVVISKLLRSYKQDIGGKFLEWPYKYVKPRVIAEPFMQCADGSELVDYKVHCFNGKPQFILVCSGRYSNDGLKDDFYDTEWNRLKCARPAHPNSELGVKRPRKLDEMFALSSQISKDFPFLRVDFYIINHKLFIGELTLFPASGFSPFVPREMDYYFGNLLTLPNQVKL